LRDQLNWCSVSGGHSGSSGDSSGRQKERQGVVRPTYTELGAVYERELVSKLRCSLGNRPPSSVSRGAAGVQPANHEMLLSNTLQHAFADKLLNYMFVISMHTSDLLS